MLTRFFSLGVVITLSVVKLASFCLTINLLVMLKIKFCDSSKLYLVFENGFHHSVYTDLKQCIEHYDSLVSCRESFDSHFDIYELSFDSDLNCFVPNGIVCRIFKNHLIQIRYKSDFDIIKEFHSFYNCVLDYPCFDFDCDSLPF